MATKLPCELPCEMPTKTPCETALVILGGARVMSGLFQGANLRRSYLKRRFPAENFSANKDVVSSAPVAQLDRASDYESGGWEFESLRAHHYSLFSKKTVLPKGHIF